MEIRTTPRDEIGILETTKEWLENEKKRGEGYGIYWHIEDTDKVIAELKQAIEEHKKKKLEEVVE